MLFVNVFDIMFGIGFLAGLALRSWIIKLCENCENCLILNEWLICVKLCEKSTAGNLDPVRFMGCWVYKCGWVFLPSELITFSMRFNVWQSRIAHARCDGNCWSCRIVHVLGLLSV
jgi:hypothetical protein